MKIHILVIALVTIFAVPTVALGASFTYSLIQGKTPTEAVSIIATQVDALFGRVDSLEAQQASTTLEIEELQAQNENLRLKADLISSSTDKIRAADERRSTCADLSEKINRAENALKAPFDEQLATLQDQNQTLSKSLQAIRTGSSTSDTDMTVEEQQENLKETAQNVASVRQQIEIVQKQMSDLGDQIQQTLDTNVDFQKLMTQANNLLCA